MKNKNKFVVNGTSEGKEKQDPLEPEFTKPTQDPANDTKPVSFIKLFRYATLYDKFLLFVGILCTIGTGVLQPFNMLIFGTFTGNIVDYASSLYLYQLGNITEEAFAEASDKFMDDVTTFAVQNTYLGVAMLVLSYFTILLFNYSSLRQIFKLRGLYLEKILNQDISWYDTNQVGDFASRMSDDISKFEDGIGEKVPMFIQFVVVFISSLILALVKGWELALICLISLPVTMIALGTVSFLTSKLAKNELDAYGAAGAIAEEVLTAIRTVIAFGGQKKEIDRYQDKLTFARDNNIKRSMFFGTGFGILWFCIYGSYALAFWYGVRLVLRDREFPVEDQIYDTETMVTVFFSVMTGSMNFGMASPYIETFSLAQAAAAKIYYVIDNIPIINASKNKGEKLDTVQGNITFKDVHFTYPSRKDVEILKGVNLEIKCGETVALVGGSGCGKSTCLQLIQRFYDPDSGTVELDGKDLKTLDLTSLRQKIGIVSQEPILFGNTIAENIRYGRQDASYEDIVKAATKANAHSFISNLPKGYDTLVGERGAQLSGGQKQRIAIARALVRDPQILLLDEATSALDTNSEAKVQAALDSASEDRTTIIVAHRLSTIRGANKIVVLLDGQVVEQGTHEELMELKKEYYSLVMAQVSTIEALERSQSIEAEREKAVEEEFTDMRKRSSVLSAHVSEMAEEEKKAESVSLWTIIKLNQKEWRYILIGSLASLVSGGAMPVFAILFGSILGLLADADENKVRTETNIYCIYFVVAGIVTGIVTFLQIYTYGIAGEKLTMRLRTILFSSILRQEIGWFDRPENGVGALSARLSGEAALVQGATGQRIGTVLQSVSTLGLGIGLSMYYEWRIGLLALAFAPFILVATFFQQRLMNVENQNQHESLQKSIKIAVEAVSNVRTVASLGCENTFLRIYIEHLVPYRKRVIMNTHARALVLGLARSLFFFAYSACLYYGGTLVRYEGLDYGNVFKVSQALIMGTVSIANALAFAPNFQKGFKAAAKILNLLHREPEIQDLANASDKAPSTSTIDYTDIFFSYPTRQSVKVLRGLSLHIKEGQTVALVGPSGCGKSTVIQLLERFYDPISGDIMIDNQNLKNYKLHTLRAELGIVSQEPNLFDRTIAENIAYGDNTRDIPLDEIMEAAKNANVHNFITSLPLGYETRLGEKGTQLSGGQKQRVAIARALVRNPRVLLLDEATSALDSESEKIVQEALDNAKKGRTCITIAHRLSTIQDADVICVIDRGVIAEMGTHEQLIRKRGLYYRLHTLNK